MQVCFLLLDVYLLQQLADKAVFVALFGDATRNEAELQFRHLFYVLATATDWLALLAVDAPQPSEFPQYSSAVDGGEGTVTMDETK